MKKDKSQILTLAMCSLFVVSGAVVQSAVAMEKMDNKISNTHTTSSSDSQSSGSVPEVSKNPSAKSGSQWSDQLIRERDEAKKSVEQAKKERDQAKKERDEAQQASSSQKGSIQAKSSSGKENQKLNQMVKERDQYLKERDALQKETANLRQERDRAMSAISGGSALDAVDSGMPVERRR